MNHDDHLREMTGQHPVHDDLRTPEVREVLSALRSHDLLGASKAITKMDTALRREREMANRRCPGCGQTGIDHCPICTPPKDAVIDDPSISVVEPITDEELAEMQPKVGAYVVNHPSVINRLVARIEADRAENERLHRNIDLCVDHLDLLRATFGGASKYYTCALCGAGPDDDHTADCPLTVSLDRMRAEVQR